MAVRIFERFSPDTLDLDQCRMLLIDLFYPGGPCCPHCGSTAFTNSQRQTFCRFGRVKCPECARWFRPMSNTPLQGSYLDPRQVVLIAVGLALDLSPVVIAALVGVTAQTVRHWRRRLN